MKFVQHNSWLVHPIAVAQFFVSKGGMVYDNQPSEMPLAYVLFRALLGVNICLHGVTRLAAGESGFAGKIASQFSNTILPHGLLLAFALALPWAEAVVGLLIILGLWTRIALAAGFLVMLALMFGICLVQDWQTAGLQLIYGIAYAALLFLLRYNQYSVDSLLQRKSRL